MKEHFVKTRNNSNYNLDHFQNPTQTYQDLGCPDYLVIRSDSQILYLDTNKNLNVIADNNQNDIGSQYNPSICFNSVRSNVNLPHKL